MRAELDMFHCDGPMGSPACSSLFALNPMGMGSGLHESLPSYIERLAQLHGVPAGPFFHNHLHPKPVPSSGSLLGIHSRALLVGGGLTDAIGQTLSEKCCVDSVQRLTHSKLAKVVSLYKDTRLHAAWCPECLRDWLAKGLPLYRPLLWSCQSVRCCPVHNLALHEACPACSRKLFHLESKGWLGACPRCGEEFKTRLTIPDTPSSYDQYVAKAVEGFLQWGVETTVSLDTGAFAENIDRAVRTLKSEYVLAEQTGLSRPVIHKWRRNRGRPLLPALLRLSHCFNIPLKTWLVESIPHEAFLTHMPLPPTVTALRRRLPSAKTISAKVSRYLQNNENEALSVRDLAGKIGADSRRLYTVCPDLTRKVAERRSQAVARRKQQSHQDRVQAVRNAISELRSQGLRVSRHAVVSLLTARGVRCAWLLKAIFRQVCPAVS